MMILCTTQITCLTLLMTDNDYGVSASAVHYSDDDSDHDEGPRCHSNSSGVGILLVSSTQGCPCTETTL